jgi:hypothetical protein
VQIKRFHRGWALRLEPGEELIGSLKELMREHGIGSGAVTGLGAVGRARLGCYLLSERRYVEREVAGDLEVVGLSGTLSWTEAGEPFPHVHIVLTDENFAATGGHCFEAEVSITLELFVRDWGERIERRRDEAIGLHLMDLE